VIAKNHGNASFFIMRIPKEKEKRINTEINNKQQNKLNTLLKSSCLIQVHVF
jgi:hypothetical protein